MTAGSTLQRSLLFVPATATRFFARARTSGADAIVLDLEDSIPMADKAAARTALTEAVAELSGGPPLRVRINTDAALLEADVAVCARLGLTDVVVPKVESPEDVIAVRGRFQECSSTEPRLHLLVESCRGLQALERIAKDSGPLGSIAIGLEDLSAELVLAAPSSAAPDDLLWAHGRLLVTATATAIPPIGLIGEIGNFRDLERFDGACRRAWRMGYRGTYCIHPDQVAVANDAYAPGRDDVAWATEVIEAYRAGEGSGRGAVAVRGAMADAPTAARAARIVEYYDAVEAERSRRSSTRRGVLPAT